MGDFLQYQFVQNALLASLVGGVSCAFIGVFVVTMQMPFLGVSMSHSAFAGALFGLFVGWDPFWSAFLFCLLTSLVIGPLQDSTGFNPGTALGIIFSLMLGLAFLFLASLAGSKTEALSFIWGSILTVDKKDLLIMASLFILILVFVLSFFKEIQAVIFSREIAESVGVPQKMIYYTILLLSGAVISANLNTIGGLLIFSLVINPAAAAYQITYSLRNMFIVSGLFGLISCFFGLLLSYYFNLPTGGVIIIVSSVIFFFCLVFSPKKRLKQRFRKSTPIGVPKYEV